MLQIKNTLGGGKPEGLFAWKKCSVVLLDSITTKVRENYELGTATFDTTVYYSTSYTFDEATGIYTLVNPQSANLAYNGSGGAATVSMEKSTYYIWGSTSSDKIYTTNDGSTYKVGIRNVGGSVYLESTVTNEKYDIHSAKAEYTFLNYIVSDKETAYPDGGEKGGYWYERVSEVKAAFGSVSISNSPSDLVINHNLGVMPTKAWGFAMKGGSYSTAFYVDGTSAYVRYGTAHYNRDATVDASNISIPSGGGGTWVNAIHHWVVIAE